MVLGESYLKGILRPPLADAKALPPNPPHPFQTDLGFYLKQRFMKNHFPLVVGFAVAIWCFTKADAGMRDAKKRNYDEAVAAGRSPCEWLVCCWLCGGWVAAVVLDDLVCARVCVATRSRWLRSRAVGSVLQQAAAAALQRQQHCSSCSRCSGCSSRRARSTAAAETADSLVFGADSVSVAWDSRFFWQSQMPSAILQISFPTLKPSSHKLMPSLPLNPSFRNTQSVTTKQSALLMRHFICSVM